MNTRIVTEPVGTAFATSDFRHRGAGAGYAPGTQVAPASSRPSFVDSAEDDIDVGASRGYHDLPPLPEPPAPPGTAFAAAVMAGALPPRPTTPQEILLRLGSAWVPPESDLQLTDFRV